MARQKQTPPDLEGAIRTAGSIGALEHLAGIGQTQDERSAFWLQFAQLPSYQSLDAGVAELKRMIRVKGGCQASQAPGRRR